MDKGTIKPNGDIVMHGCVPSKTVLVGITPSFIAIKHPGGVYYDNGGRQYCAAWVQVSELESLKKINAAGDIVFTIKRTGNSISFHPQQKPATQDAMRNLARIMERS